MEINATAYVGRNASLPLIAQLAISIGFVVGGSILIESIFVYQGIGYQLLNAINTRDYPVMQGIFLVITVSVIPNRIGYFNEAFTLETNSKNQPHVPLRVSYVGVKLQ